MANSWFQFQQFRVQQDRCAMKITTDAVLLGALADFKSPKEILDIGTGTGVIALMLAQRFPESKVTALEISTRLTLQPIALQDFSAKASFDLIVSNPPYFPDHLKSSDAKRNLALHSDSLCFEDLLSHASQLLTSSGEFWAILPPRQMRDFCMLAEEVSLYPNLKIQIRDSENKPIHREIAAFSKTEKKPSYPDQIYCLKSPDGDYSEAYRRILAGFLLGY
jgi:tRNA1Val (adenine37-N6)-methyltransferase